MIICRKLSFKHLQFFLPCYSYTLQCILIGCNLKNYQKKHCETVKWKKNDTWFSPFFWINQSVADCIYVVWSKMFVAKSEGAQEVWILLQGTKCQLCPTFLLKIIAKRGVKYLLCHGPKVHQELWGMSTRDAIFSFIRDSCQLEDVPVTFYRLQKVRTLHHGASKGILVIYGCNSLNYWATGLKFQFKFPMEFWEGWHWIFVILYKYGKRFSR